jgi:hypothetical protein
VIIRGVILCVYELLPFAWGVVFGGMRWSNLEDVHNFVPCHPPHIDGQVDPSLLVVLVGLCHMLFG